MLTANLRKVGGSVMLALPPAILEALNLNAGTTVALAVHGNRLVIEARPRLRYTLAELLAASDYTQPLAEEDQAWIGAPAVGRELL